MRYYPYYKSRTYNGKSVVSDIELWTPIIQPHIEASNASEATKVRSLITMVEGAAFDFLNRFAQDGSISAMRLLRALYANFQSKESISSLILKLNSFKRQPGQHIQAYRLFVEKRAQIIYQRVEGENHLNPILHTVKWACWGLILNELPDELREIIEGNFDFEVLDQACTRIETWSGHRLRDSPFSEENLSRELTHNTTFREVRDRGLQWPLPKKKIEKPYSQPKAYTNKANNTRRATHNVLAIAAPPEGLSASGGCTKHPETLEVTGEPMINACYNCREEGHLARDCTKTTQIKQTVSGARRKDPRKPFKRTRGKSVPSQPNLKYYCRLCEKNGHSLTYCRIFIRAKKLIKDNNVPEARANLAQMADEDPLGPDLRSIRETIIPLLEESLPGLDIQEKVNILLVNQALFTEEGYDLSSEESSDEDSSD